jgi:hypothetical protein
VARWNIDTLRDIRSYKITSIKHWEMEGVDLLDWMFEVRKKGLLLSTPFAEIGFSRRVGKDDQRIELRLFKNAAYALDQEKLKEILKEFNLHTVYRIR